MSEKEQQLWTSVYVATIGLLLGDGENDAASTKAEYLANDAVDKFRAAFPEND